MLFPELREFEDPQASSKSKELHLQLESNFLQFFQPGIELLQTQNTEEVENDENVLELELRVKGSLNEERLLIYLTEVFNQVSCDYMFESSFQSIYQIYNQKGKNITPKEIQEISIDFLDSLDQTLSALKYDSNSVQKWQFSHGFLVSTLMELCREIKKIFVAEFSKKINKNENENYFPFVYYLEINHENTDKYSRYHLFDKLEGMAEFFENNYVNDTEKFIRENPRITIFLSSFCIQKNFDCAKDREVWTDLEINKIRNFDSVEFMGSGNTKFKTGRNFFFKAVVSVGKLSVLAYNMNWELMTNIKTSLKKIEDWSWERVGILKHVLLQKLGFYGYKLSLKRKNVKKVENDYINTINQLYHFREKNHIKEEEKKEDENKATVTKAIFSRIENLFPVIDSVDEVKFQEMFRKVINVYRFFCFNFFSLQT